MSKINIVKKLSGKVLVGNVKAYIKDLQEGQTLDLYRVVGIARGVKNGTSTFGDYTALMGDFVAEALVGSKIGQRSRTGQLFLPDVALNLVSSTVENLSKGEGVELAFTVGITASESSAIGYEYNCSFLVEPGANDPLEALMAKALPAPAKEDAKGKAKEPA